MCPKSLQKSYSVHRFTSQNNAPIEFHFFSCKGRDLGGDSSKRCIQKLCFCLLGITDGIFPLNGC